MTEPQSYITIEEVGGHLPIEEWRELTWAECAGCGEALYGPSDENEQMYDGEPMVCSTCGLVHYMFADADGHDYLPQWTYLNGHCLLALNVAINS